MVVLKDGKASVVVFPLLDRVEGREISRTGNGEDGLWAAYIACSDTLSKKTQ